MITNVPLPIIIDAASIERFFRFVSPEPNTGCWLWTGTGLPVGYGKFGAGVLNEHRMVLAHRFSFTAFRGPIPPGFEIDHRCGVTCCVNPDHLQPATHRDNTMRSNSIAAVGARRTLCPQGHPYDRHDGRGRRCSVCRREQCRRSWRRFAARQKAAA